MTEHEEDTGWLQILPGLLVKEEEGPEVPKTQDGYDWPNHCAHEHWPAG
jgi:hypothetical protein